MPSTRVTLLLLVLIVIAAFLFSVLKSTSPSFIKSPVTSTNNVTTTSPNVTSSIPSKTGKISALRIGETVINTILADTPAKRTQGLSGMDSIASLEGMLFIFDTPAAYGFWMKDMKFPIDIIWIDKNLKISDIVTDIEPESYPKIFNPRSDSLYVLEVNAGFVASRSIKIGDQVTFIKN